MMLAMISLTVALTAFAVYVLVSLGLGDVYPFSRYSMYARLTTRKEGAVLYVRAGDRFVAPDDLDEVCGLDVDALDPIRHGIPTSHEWVSHEAMRWLRQRSRHHVMDGVVVEVGYRMLRIDETGRLHERLWPRTTGVGSLRR